jgi:hypothetical protein
LPDELPARDKRSGKRSGRRRDRTTSASTGAAPHRKPMPPLNLGPFGCLIRPMQGELRQQRASALVCCARSAHIFGAEPAFWCSAPSGGNVK